MRSAIISKKINAFSTNFDTTVFKTGSHMVINFKTVSFDLTQKQPVKGRLDGVGQGWFITDIGYMVKKKKHLCSLSDVERNKLIFSEIPCCFEFPYDCGKKLSTVTLLCFFFSRRWQ